MNAETLKRARWVYNSPTTKILKCAAKDGGAVLATVDNAVFMGVGSTWRAGAMWGKEQTYEAAQRAARRALAAQIHAEPFGPRDVRIG